MTTRLRVLAALLLLLVLTSCGWQGQGVVAEKLHRESYYWTTLQCSAWDNKGNCTFQMPVQHYVPPWWGYKVRDSNGDEHEVTTSESDWEAHKVGDRFDNRTKQK